MSLLAHCLVSTPFGAHLPCWHIARDLVSPCWHTASCPLPLGLNPLANISPGVWFFSPIDVESHNSPPLRPSVLVGTQCPLPSDLASSLAHRPMSDSNNNCNGSSPSLTDIILFRFSLSTYLSKFLKRV